MRVCVEHMYLSNLDVTLLHFIETCFSTDITLKVRANKNRRLTNPQMKNAKIFFKKVYKAMGSLD